MRDLSNPATRQTVLNRSRIYQNVMVTVIAVLCAIAVTLMAIMFHRSFAPIDTVQATKVERASAYLQEVGFNDPVYLGVKPATEGEYPTFRATAIGGEYIDLLIRTTPNGGWEIQPVDVFESVTSADDFARMAQEAVLRWENIPDSIKPSTDGAFREYEHRKLDFDLLKKYNPDPSYWDTPRNETDGWPRK